MEIKKSISTAVEAPKSRPVLFYFAMLLLLGLVAFAFYLSFTKTAIQDQQKQLDDSIASLNSQINDLRGQNVEGQQYAQQWLADLEKNEIHWSEVIKTIEETLPVDPLTQKPLVQFLTYSGSAGGKLTLNAQTVEGAANPFQNLTTLLSAFNSSAFFKDAYVPSASHGVAQSGQDILSFVFNVTYQEGPAAPSGSLPGGSFSNPVSSGAVPVNSVAPSSTQQSGSTVSRSAQPSPPKTSVPRNQ